MVRLVTGCFERLLLLACVCLSVCMDAGFLAASAAAAAVVATAAATAGNDGDQDDGSGGGGDGAGDIVEMGKAVVVMVVK